MSKTQHNILLRSVPMLFVEGRKIYLNTFLCALFCFFFGHMERHTESYFLNYWSHPHPLHCKQGVLTTGSPGNSPKYMFLFSCCCSWVIKSCLTLCDPMDYSPPGSSVHGISQARILKWVAISYSRGSYPPKDQTHISCIARRILYHWAIEEAPD